MAKRYVPEETPEEKAPKADVSSDTPTGAVGVLEVPTVARRAHLTDLVDILKAQDDVKYDVVAPSKDLRYLNGHLIVANGGTYIRPDGVGLVDVPLAPTEIFERGIATKLEIPWKYLDKMRRQQEITLLDINVNTWLMSSDRNWLVRGFRRTDGQGIGVARAFLSDKYKLTDNYDVLVAALDGVRAIDVEAQVTEANLSERGMSINVTSPEITAQAGRLTDGYNSPFQDALERANRIHGGDAGGGGIQAGVRISNSETGNGAWSITPRIVFTVCSNGWTITRDMMRKVHLGGAMDVGEVKWQEDTMEQYVELVRKQTRDTVMSFLSEDYLMSVVNELDRAARTQLDRPMELFEKATKPYLNESEQAAVLDFFIKGGDTRAIGVGQAITAYAQTVADPDRALELEDAALPATLGLV